MSEIKERPIIFSSKSVQAILEGVKTQTRRLIKFKQSSSLEWKQAVQIPNDYSWIFWSDYRKENIKLTANAYNPGDGIKCNYGIPGDRLWVRETWFQTTNKELNLGKIIYKADGWESKDRNYPIAWHPSIFMPRQASRITLEITNIRVERLQDISIDDIYAEGCPAISSDADGSKLYEWYSDFWDSINAKRGYSWESNPFVWVIEFKYLEKENN